jgi:hypothetical protein
MKHEGSVKVEGRVLRDFSHQKLYAGFARTAGSCSKLRETVYKVNLL